MQTSPITEPAAQASITRTSDRHRPTRAHRSFARAPKRGTRTCANIALPPKLWDRIVLFTFACCLFTFLHALFGLGLVREDLRVPSHTFEHSHMSPSASPPWNRGSVVLHWDQRIRMPSVTRMMVDWHGNYELLPSTASALVSPATTPQVVFPDPTPALARAEVGRALDEGSFSVTTKVNTLVDNPSTFYGIPYDPFRLIFEDTVDGGEDHAPYPVARPPRTVSQAARARRFGR